MELTGANNWARYTVVRLKQVEHVRSFVSLSTPGDGDGYEFQSSVILYSIAMGLSLARALELLRDPRDPKISSYGVTEDLGGAADYNGTTLTIPRSGTKNQFSQCVATSASSPIS